MSCIGQEEEAALYYLYMMSDGEISYNEEKIFNEICKELELSEAEKQSVIANAKKLASDSKMAKKAIKNNDIDPDGWFDTYRSMRGIPYMARIIWNLVNLGYADSYYSEDEKEIVQYLLDKWEINKELYIEMIDTSDTMLALIKQKEWILSTYDKGKDRDDKERKIDSEINSLLSDIKISIDELSM